MLESHTKKLPKIIYIFFVFWLYVLPVQSDSAEVTTATDVEIIYAGNEGFLVMAEGKKVLIDAFHRLGDVKNQEMLQNGRPPFDDVDLILTTHTDHDHFDLHMVGDYLKTHPHTVLVSTDQAKDSFVKYYRDFEKIESRIRGYTTESGEKISVSHAGIELTMMHLQHGRNREVKVTNLGFLFVLGGKKFFHMGDSEIILSEMSIYDLPKERIDVAFIPYWYFTSAKYRPALQNGIGAKYLVPMHLILVDGGPQERERILESIRAEFPESILFSTEMEKRIIE